MIEIKELKNLKSLSLIYTKVTDVGLRELQELRNMQSLSLHTTNVTESGLRVLRELKNLKSLSLAHTNVSNSGVKSLKSALPETEISYVENSRTLEKGKGKKDCGK